MEDDVVYLYTNSIHEAGRLVSRAELPADARKLSGVHYYSEVHSADPDAAMIPPRPIPMYLIERS